MARAQRKRKTTRVRGKASSAKTAIKRKNNARGKSKSKTKNTAKDSFFNEALSFLFFALSLALAFSVFSKIRAYYLNSLSSSENLLGVFGESISSKLFEQLGLGAFFAPLWLFMLSAFLWKGPATLEDEEKQKFFLSFVSSFFLLSFSCVLFAQFFDLVLGGRLGANLYFKFQGFFGSFGSFLISTLGGLFFLSLTFGFRLSSFFAPLRNLLSNILFPLIKNIFSDIGYFIGNIIKFIFSSFSSIFSFSSSGEMREEMSSRENSRKPSFLSKSLKSSPKSYTLGDSELEFIDAGEERDEPMDDFDISSELARGDFSLDDIPSEIKISRGVFEDEPEKQEKKGLFSKLKPSKKINPLKEEPESNQFSPDYEDYEFPNTDILIKGGEDFYNGPEDKELLDNSHQLEKALKDFKIGGKVTEVHPGPVITLYQFHPAAGVKVQRIVNLADDLALALKVPRVRVYAPVPGKGAVGIEVPNSERQIVRLRDVLESEEHWNTNTPLELAMGKDTFGEPVVADLAKMPHLLIAGATGTGKSVCINSILMSLLYRNTPEDLRLLLIDPKMLELSVYERIPHLKAPVVTNPKHARGLLWWAVEEMERRYKLMMRLGVRSLENYNQAVSSNDSALKRKSRKKKNVVIELEEHHVVSTSSEEGLDREIETELEDKDGGASQRMGDVDSSLIDDDAEKLPRIVIVVDELADLMLTVGRDIEELLTRLAQKARAAGIHLIIATQRPSVNVITGLIKANFPARISFQVASKIDSRTIIDMSGAEKLLGQGDMLFLPPGTGRLRRLHSPFVSDSEVRDVIAHIREQGEADYDPEISKVIERMEESEASADSIGGGVEEYDPLHDKAVALVIERGQASTSMVQRAFRIGYNRAARILDVMEAEGVVGPAAGAKARKVLVGGAGE